VSKQRRSWNGIIYAVKLEGDINGERQNQIKRGDDEEEDTSSLNWRVFL